MNKWILISIIALAVIWTIIFCLLTFFTWSDSSKSNVYTAGQYEILGATVSNIQYNSIKNDLSAKLAKANAKLTYQEAQEWISIANREIQVCGLTFSGITPQNIVSKINQSMGSCNL